jgi:hypothetical protein
MKLYKVYYTATVFHQCECEIEAESKDEAIEQVMSDAYYEDDSVSSDYEIEIEFANEV